MWPPGQRRAVRARGIQELSRRHRLAAGALQLQHLHHAAASAHRQRIVGKTQHRARIVETAREVFAVRGADASLEEIARGAGVNTADVNNLLKQFKQVQQMMKGMGKGGLGRMMRSMAGRLPTGLR